MRYEELRFWLEVLQFIVTILIGVFAWWRTRDRNMDSRFGSIDKRLGQLDKKVGEIETTLKHPSVCDQHARMERNDVKLFERFDELHGDLRGVAGELKSLVGAVNMINEHLINSGRKQ